MKTVFNSSMCAHVWAQLKQSTGRNASNSMHFDGALAYSYREPVAHIVDGAFGKVALFTSRTWSVTTTGHVANYKSAASQFDRFTVPNIGASRRDGVAQIDHAENLAHFAEKYDVACAELMRCPADSWRLADITDSDGIVRADGIAIKDAAELDIPHKATRPHSTLRGLYGCSLEYARAFGIVAPVLPWQRDADAAIARRDRIMNDPKRAHKMALAAKARERADIAKEAKRVEKRRIDMLESAERVRLWQSGNPAATLRYDDVLHDRGDLLRIVGDTVQTSRGAECPLDHARLALRLWRRTIDAGMSWEPNGHAVHLGHFTLDSIGADGTVRAGCHTIKRTELERLELAVSQMDDATRTIDHGAIAAGMVQS